MMVLSMDLGKLNTVCCFFDTRTRKHRFETIATTTSWSATIHVALSNEYLARQGLASLEETWSKFASKR